MDTKQPEAIENFLTATLALGKYMRDVALDAELGSGEPTRIAGVMAELTATVANATRTSGVRLAAAGLLVNLASGEGDTLEDRCVRVLQELDAYAKAKPQRAGGCSCFACAQERKRNAPSAAEQVAQAVDGKVVGNA